MDTSTNKPSSNNRIIVICGPTSTGKTMLGLKLAKQINGDLISADSRQLYKHMDIGTGKDIPSTFTKSTKIINGQQTVYYTDNSINIWGYDITDPDKAISISLYSTRILPILHHIWKQGKIPILIGGSGLYIQSIINPPQTSTIPTSKNLRNKISKKSVQELQLQLKRVRIQSWDRMNQSDRNNPRRLIRAIEVANYQGTIQTVKSPVSDALQIGLQLPFNELKDRIKDRVLSRISRGYSSEVNFLRKKYPQLNLQSFTAMGYQEWAMFLDKKLTKIQATERWISRENKYAKRQITWFKKQKNINWFNITSPQWGHHVEHLVKTWYAN